jgi:hypothetical protein
MAEYKEIENFMKESVDTVFEYIEFNDISGLQSYFLENQSSNEY